MQSYVADVTEVSYLDNYENGQVSGYHVIPITTEKFGSITEAVKWFKDNYADPSWPMELLNEEGKIVAPHKPSCADDGFFVNASDKDIEAWKAGKKDLYSVEYQLTVHVVNDVSVMDLEFTMKAANV